ncbi:MAG: phosphopantothenoylcysteine decarboxylase, partial [Candidatus Nitrosocaldaceae archaeon]
PKDLIEKKVVVSAGPTREAIDSVRFISNRSSGKMGYALAQVAKARGAEGVLVSGPTSLKAPYGVKMIAVESAKEMADACIKEAKDADIIISCMLILGLGGKKYSTLHAIESAKIINIIEPDYLAALTLYLDDSIKDEFCSKFEEQFEMLSDQDVLEELKVMVQNINNKRKIIFRVNHASNPYPLKALLPDEKEELLRKIDTLLKSPELYRPRFLRGF